MAQGLLLDFLGTIARPSGAGLGPVLREVRNLGYEVYEPELQASCDFVLRVEFPGEGYAGPEAFVEAVMEHLGHRPKRTELMSLAPLLAEYYGFTLYEDAERAVPGLLKSRKVAVLTGFPSFALKPVLEPFKGALAVITPKEAKAAPPHAKTFRAGAQALGLRSRDITVVSADHEDWLAVPKGIGFRTVHVRRAGSPPCLYATVEIPSLVELEDVLKPPPPKAPPTPPAASNP